MAYQQDSTIKSRQLRSKQAITLAMQGRWQEAITVNKLILESFPKDVEAYNRLGRAYSELGEYASARDAYQQTLAIDQFNTIAKKNLDRLANLGKSASNSEVDSHHAEPQIFIEEIGKSGVVNLNGLAPKEILAKMTAGDMVNLKIDGNNLVVENSAGDYIGLVEPRHAQRLIKLIQGGNKYTAAIISSAEDKVTVIIREEYQDPAQAGQLSFPPKGAKIARPLISGKVVRPEDDEESAEEPPEVFEDSNSQE
jgi:tetratricopeptide (TPR) repeat protein